MKMKIHVFEFISTVVSMTVSFKSISAELCLDIENDAAIYFRTFACLTCPPQTADLKFDPLVDVDKIAPSSLPL